AYYEAANHKEIQWKEKLGADLNWHLSFTEYTEAERTKHVHRLHPYKGKFIPQLVEYFLDDHTDEFKKQIYFHPGDIILDPFCGSGTTLVQANELGLHAIGIDVSAFNTLISNVKIKKYDIEQIRVISKKITDQLKDFQMSRQYVLFDNQLTDVLTKFNLLYFPAPEFRRKVHEGIINEKEYAKQKEAEFIQQYQTLLERYQIKIKQDKRETFLDKWFLYTVREEIDFVSKEIEKISDNDLRNVFSVILSRTVRSCRATTHADLATLKEPVLTPYYCKKHGKICKPIFSILNWWARYTEDTLERLKEFDRLRTHTHQVCITGDSRSINIMEEVKRIDPVLGKMVVDQKIKGIFSSPPYVGLIDYHEQHAYSYEIFGLDRKDQQEIGAMSKGQGKEARMEYIHGIAQVLLNCKQYLQENYEVFLVANDKFNLYPEIARLAGMRIENRYKRPVLNRVEKDRSNAYSEIIFHLREA
ncbi:MAG: DNA methyltransferase, partial [Anaerolineales bacterium]